MRFVSKSVVLHFDACCRNGTVYIMKLVYIPHRTNFKKVEIMGYSTTAYLKAHNKAALGFIYIISPSIFQKGDGHPTMH